MEALAPHWVARRWNAVAEALFPDLMLFGEWCYALHSVHCTKLPDWFLAFDVYDRAAGAFWSVERRNELDRRLGLAIRRSSLAAGSTWSACYACSGTRG